mmetsp:Transcript_9055/g.33779  ORF Transcript_9055/g.33779 Transcript_9055/m.33779 type:complete len:213 (-) Transcript_9055:12250-12888(-)
MSRVCRYAPLAKITAWFWFSGLPSPIIGFPGSLILKSTRHSPDVASRPMRHDAKSSVSGSRGTCTKHTFKSRWSLISSSIASALNLSNDPGGASLCFPKICADTKNSNLERTSNSAVASSYPSKRASKRSASPYKVTPRTHRLSDCVRSLAHVCTCFQCVCKTTSSSVPSAPMRSLKLSKSCANVATIREKSVFSSSRGVTSSLWRYLTSSA